MDMKVVCLCACTRYIHYYKSEVEIYLLYRILEKVHIYSINTDVFLETKGSSFKICVSD